MDFIQGLEANMKIILQESDYAFSIMTDSGGSNNTDYADFTSNNFIKSFRHILQKPDLSRAQLASMLRQAERRKNRRDNDDKWADKIAAVVSGNANNNVN
jgi:hypothetical protein